MQNAHPSATAVFVAVETRRVFAEQVAASTRFNGHQSNIRIVKKSVEETNRVRATSGARDHHARQLPGPSHNLLARLATNYALKLAHHQREWMRAERAAEQVVRVMHVRHPIAQGFVDRVFQGAGSRVHRNHLGAEQLHAENIQRLSPDILGAHVNDTAQTEKSANRGGGDTMLP